MNIGLTYDLRKDYLADGYSEEETAEFDRPDTIEAIESALINLGYRTDRIGNARRLVERLARGDRWDLVFNIAEGLHGFARESQVPSILDVYDVPYTFSDPFALTLSLHKGMAKSVLKKANIPTPDFALVERESDIAAIDLPFPLFAKPVAEGTSKGISEKSVLRDRHEMHKVCVDLLNRFRQPVLVETFLPGREFTVGITGTGEMSKVLGTMEIHLLPNADAEVYSYGNKENYEDLVRYQWVAAESDRLINEVEELARSAWRVLDGRDAGRIDIRCDQHGQPQFIESNPIPGLNPHRSDLPILCGFLGVPYVELIERIVSSAKQRLMTGPAKQVA